MATGHNVTAGDRTQAKACSRRRKERGEAGRRGGRPAGGGSLPQAVADGQSKNPVAPEKLVTRAQKARRAKKRGPARWEDSWGDRGVRTPCDRKWGAAGALRAPQSLWGKNVRLSWLVRKFLTTLQTSKWPG